MGFICELRTLPSVNNPPFILRSILLLQARLALNLQTPPAIPTQASDYTLCHRPTGLFGYLTLPATTWS